VQRLGRALILLRILVFIIWESGLFKIVFLIAIILKLGGAPFQFWYLKLIQKINWNNIWILSIWQKLIPLVLIKFREINFLLMFSFLRILIGSLGRLKQKKIKKILGLSSLFSLGWVLRVLRISKVWIWFIAGYGIVLFNLIYNLKNYYLLNTENLEDLLTNPFNLILFFLNLLMVRGIPPFLVFFLKILILSILIKLNIVFVLIYLLLRVLIIYIYLIIAFSRLTFFKLKENSFKVVSRNKFNFLNLLLQSFIFTVVLIVFI